MKSKPKEWLQLFVLVVIGAVILSSFEFLRKDGDFTIAFLFITTNVPALVFSVIVGLAIGALLGDRVEIIGEIAGAIVGGLLGAFLLYPFISNLISEQLL